MKIIVLLILLIASAGILLLIRIMRKTARNRELTQAAADKVRDENLNKIIVNSYAQRSGQKEVHKPYDVDYGSKNKEKRKSAKGRDGNRQIMIQLIEKTELSTRKFILDPTRGIRIGSDLQGNDITVFDGAVSPCQCEIFSAGDKVYIKDTGTTNRTVVKRKKRQAAADSKGIRLISNDVIVLGRVSYDITILDGGIFTEG